MKLITIYHSVVTPSNAIHYRDTYYGQSSSGRLHIRILNIKGLPTSTFNRVIRSIK